MKRLPLLIPVFLLLLGLEAYLYQAFSPLFGQALWLKATYFLFQLGAVGSILLAILKARSSTSVGVKSPITNFFNGAIIAFGLPKLVAGMLLLAEDIIRVLRYAGNAIANQLNLNGTYTVHFPERSGFFVTVVFLAAMLFCIALIYGILFGKYRYKLKEITIESEDVPASFDGYKIVQFSDVHSGTFDSVPKVKKGIDLINAQEADLVLFTGDMVNNQAIEIKPFIDLFRSINSKDGKFSILGNHDYGDYVGWKSGSDKARNLDQLIAYQAEMGFTMMRNTHTQIERNGEFIHVLGVENWGKPPFQQYGDLEQAAIGVTSEQFTVLMSHDPSHWDYKVKEHPKDINLTLSGHTHGMQLGIDWLGIKWSPVKYLYRKWAGLYTENNRHLYVNRGFGFLGWPGRLGIWPEITLICLRRIK